MSLGQEWTSPVNFVDSQKTAFDAWALCLRRKWLILFVLCLSLGLGYLYYVKATPIYEAQALVLVVNRQTSVDLPQMRSEMGYEDTLSNHIILIKTPTIIKTAIEDADLASLPTLRNEANPIMAIIENLEAGRAGGKDFPDSDVMQIAYQSTDDGDARKVLGAILKSYQAFLRKSRETSSEQLEGLITQLVDELKQQYNDEQTKYDAFRNNAPRFWTGVGGPSLPEIHMRELETTISQLQLQRTQAKSKLATIQRALQQGDVDREAILIMLGEHTNSQQVRPTLPIASIEQELLPLLVQAGLLEARLGAEHPDVKAVREQIRITTEILEGTQREILDRYEQAAFQGDYLAMYMQGMETEIASLDEMLKQMGEMLEMEEAEARQMQAFMHLDETYRWRLEDIREDQKLMRNKISMTDFSNDVPQGYQAEVVADPDAAVKVAPNIFKVMGVASFLGLLVGFGLAYLVDMADKSFRSPEEVRTELGVPILGHVPVIVPEMMQRRKDSKSTVDRMVCTFHQPKSTMSEAYRAVRTALNFGTRGEGHKVVQITSPDPGDGKTTLITNLAVSLAQAGKRVLVVDADFRRPRVHKAFGITNDVGMSNIITGRMEPPDAIQATEMENLWVLACGPRPPNPSEMLSSERFKELIEMFRDQYDIVLVDTPPVLAVTDACVVAPRVDGVLLLLRITKYVRPHAKRAVEILESLGANMLGLVINGVGGSRPSLGYGFGQQYGYRYASEAGYYDTYGEHHYGAYYTDDDEDDDAPAGKSRRQSNGAPAVDDGVLNE